MKQFRLNIDGKEILGLPGQTILDVARANDIDIPTFCFDDRTEIYGACGLCVVEIEGFPKMVKACATEIADNMVILTNTPRVRESRKTNLELLLSNHIGDCRPPCTLACPARTDCQGYVGLIANGQFREALKLIKDSIPLPGAIGRVCPHPCEEKCRRGLMEEPISIVWLKRFAADFDEFGEDPFMPEIAPETGKSVAVIGGGPLGLSAAYFLRRLGHAITIFEAMPKLGGMLRYGIPEYRLPNEVLDEEIDLIERMGVELRPNTRVGQDLPFEAIRKKYDAVFIGIGAWVSTGVGCPGEDAQGVFGGIDFLRKVVRNEPVELGRKVAIVGGGNTAMDACRTAVRLGAEKVYNVYRRTKDEMPADEIEIIEAEEEGVIFKNLTNPNEILTDAEGRVRAMRLQIMELGEPDASGRRSPKPVPGKEETIEVDTVIMAIGQAVDPAGFKGLTLTKKKGIVADKETFLTNLEGVFAGGDCANDKISIAIEAIADAKKAAGVIDAYLNGEKIGYRTPFGVVRMDITEKTFEDRERQCRPKMEHLSPEARKGNFTEVVAGYDEIEAMAEASRCLECGCHDFFECKLVKYANEYEVKPARLRGDVNKTEMVDNHPFIIRDPNKCILCGLCVRICDEVMGVGALGLVDRGFDTVVKPTLELPLAESGCISCGQCVSVCPVGALQERVTMLKPVPVETECVASTCGYCSVGCGLVLETHGNMLVKSVPDLEGEVNHGLLCGRGRFGYDFVLDEERLLEPLIKKDGQFEGVDYHEAFVFAAKKAQSLAARHGRDSVAVAISDRYSNEEAYVIKKLAESIGARTLCFNHRPSGLARVLGADASPNSFDEMLATEVLLVAGFSMKENPIAGLKVRQAAQKGVKVLVISPEGLEDKRVEDYASLKVTAPDDVDFLKQVAKALIEMGKKPANAGGFNAFKDSLEGVKVGPQAREIAEIYGQAKKAMILFGQNQVSVEAAELIADLAVLSGHIGSPRNGIVQVKAKNNSQGLVDLGVSAGPESLAGVKALLIFGEDPQGFDFKDIEFMMVCDTHLTETAGRADVVIPGTAFISTDGTFTNTERRLNLVEAAMDEGLLFENWEVAAELAHVFEVDMPFAEVEDIIREMEARLPYYREAEIGEIYGGGVLYRDGFAFKDGKARLAAVGQAKFIDTLRNSDHLMRMINEQLPKPVVI